MSEKRLKKQIHKAFENYANEQGIVLHWQLHEDGFSVGIPDISFGIHGINGWIEAKWTNKELVTSNVYDPHFETFQEAWIVARGRAGHNVWVIHGFTDKTVILSYECFMYRRRGMTLDTLLELGAGKIVENPMSSRDVRAMMNTAF